MNDRAALLANVLNDPADDTARLVLADWLEEHGEESLGRFIRAGVVASRFPSGELIDDPTYYETLAEIANVAASGETLDEAQRTTNFKPSRRNQS